MPIRRYCSDFAHVRNYRERTKVFDLESDYSHVEKDPFLSADERKRVRKRLQELKDMKEQKRKQLVLNLNLLDLSVSEQVRGLLY